MPRKKQQHCEERRDPPQQRLSEWTGAPLEFQIRWHNFAAPEKCGKFSFRRLRIAKKLSQWINACRRGFSSYSHFSGLDGMWGGIVVQQRVAADLCVYLSLYPRGSSSLHTPSTIFAMVWMTAGVITSNWAGVGLLSPHHSPSRAKRNGRASPGYTSPPLYLQLFGLSPSSPVKS